MPQRQNPTADADTDAAGAGSTTGVGQGDAGAAARAAEAGAGGSTAAQRVLDQASAQMRDTLKQAVTTEDLLGAEAIAALNVQTVAHTIRNAMAWDAVNLGKAIDAADHSRHMHSVERREAERTIAQREDHHQDNRRYTSIDKVLAGVALGENVEAAAATLALELVERARTIASQKIADEK